jgi:hypothetical protein
MAGPKSQKSLNPIAMVANDARPPVSSKRHERSFAAVESSEPLVGDPGGWRVSIVEHFATQ